MCANFNNVNEVSLLINNLFLAKKHYHRGFSSKNVLITSKKSHFWGDSW